MKSNPLLYKIANYWKAILMIILCLVLFFIRVINLDADVPNWGMTHYMPIDEGSYVLMALNKYDYGSIDPSYLFDGIAPYVAPQLRNNLIGNLITYASLRLFGDNYYGLRLPSVLYASILFCCIAFLMYKIFKKSTYQKTYNKILGIFIFLMLLFDFDLLVSSRVCENSLLRAVFVIIVLLLFDLLKKYEFKRYFVITFIATISVFLVYITNVFLILAIGITLITETLILRKNDFIKDLFGCLTGGVSGLILSEIYYINVWHTEAFENMFSVMKAFTTANAMNNYAAATSLEALGNRLVSFVSSDIFLYNLPFIFVVMSLAPFILYKVWKSKDIFMISVMLIITSFLVQTLFAEDVIIKKFLIVYSCIILIGYYGLVDIGKIYLEIVSYKKKLLKLLGYGIYLIICLIIVYKIYSYRRYGLLDNSVLDFQTEDFSLLHIGLVLTGFWTLLLFISFFNLKFKRLYLISIYGCIVVSILINVKFSYKYVFSNPTFSEKEVMISLGDKVGNDYVVGEYTNGYRLYNNIKAIPLASYDDIKKFIEAHPDYWYFDYYFPEENRESYFNSIPLQNSKYTGIPEEIYKREYQNYGEKRSVCLYTIQLKENY